MHVQHSVTVPRSVIHNRESRAQIIAEARDRLVRLGLATQEELAGEPSILTSASDPFMVGQRHVQLAALKPTRHLAQTPPVGRAGHHDLSSFFNGARRSLWGVHGRFLLSAGVPPDISATRPLSAPHPPPAPPCFGIRLTASVALPPTTNVSSRSSADTRCARIDSSAPSGSCRATASTTARCSFFVTERSQRGSRAGRCAGGCAVGSACR